MKPDRLDALVQAAWGQHHRQPARLVGLGQGIVAAAEPGSAACAWGWLHQAWGQRFAGQYEAAAQALAQAEALFTPLAHPGGLAACRDLQAMVLGLQRQLQPALALLDHNAALPPVQRSPYERMQTHQLRGWLLNLLGRSDDVLRDRYATLAVARDTDDPAAVAHALGLLGGAHADRYNLEEADRLCGEGVALAQAADAFQAFVLAALNQLIALVALGRGPKALPLVQALRAREPELNQRAREQRCVVYAQVYLQTGDTNMAQSLLDESLQHRHPGSHSQLSWTTAQVACWAAQGRLAEARQLGDGWLAHPELGTDPAQVPTERLLLLQQLGRVCEQLGDPAGALRHEREAFAVHEALVGRSARARRLTLEIEHQLDRERWQREQAQQRQQAAEAEGARLDQANRALEAANQAKTRFLAAASHDLRQPVQALAMNMAALQCETLSPAQGQLVQRMGQSLSALARMFDVLLDISRLDAGIVPVRPQLLDLRPLLYRLVDEYTVVASTQGLALRLRLPPAAAGALRTRTDPVLLERCLRNLLDNALKYTRAGGVQVRLRRQGPAGVRTGATAGAPAWSLAVLDTGLGMTPEVQAQVFDEFFQADNPERDRSRGLGLGLSIVQRVARLLGHAVVLQSRPGRGTRIGLVLPCLAAAEVTAEVAAEVAAAVAAEVAVSGAAEAAAPFDRASGFAESAHRPQHTAAAPVAAQGNVAAAAAAGSIGSPPRCVAVVDDDAAVRDSLVAVLERWGYTAVAGADPAAVLAAWRASGEPPALALLADLRLRGSLTGVQAVANLRQAWGAAVPALVITGDVAPERLQLLRDSGLPWLSKPVMPMRLRSWLAGLAGNAA